MARPRAGLRAPRQTSPPLGGGIAPKPGSTPKYLAIPWLGSDRPATISYRLKTKKVHDTEYSRSKSWEDFVRQRDLVLD